MALCPTTALREPWNYGLRGWISTRSNDLARVLLQVLLKVYFQSTSGRPFVRADRAAFFGHSAGVLWGLIQGSASGMKMSSGQMGRRLLGLTVAGMTLAAGGAAFGAQPKPWEMTLQEAATPVMENIISFHNLLLVDHHDHHAVRAGASGHRGGEVQRQGQSDPLQDHPQHADRGGLDADPGADPGRHRGAVVPPACSSSSTFPRPI